MGFTEELELFLRARYALMNLSSIEEERALQTLRELCKKKNRCAFTWDQAEGFLTLYGDAPSPNKANEPIRALANIDDYEGEAVFVLMDFHECLESPQVKRKLRSVVHRLKYTKKSIVMTSPVSKLPQELKDEAVMLELPPPSTPQIEKVLDRLLRTPGVQMRLDEDGKERLISAAKGLTSAQAQRIFSLAIVKDGVIDESDITLVTQEKKQVIGDSKALEFYSVEETIDDVGGLKTLKNWIRTRARAFTPEAKRYGLPAPKGIALIGIPGTGKSLSAKMIAGMWQQPLIRLDVGALFGSFMGESEERARHALQIAETIAPCVLWIDEMEKALAQGGKGSTDGGTSTRVFGTILTWMQEKSAQCFVVATANDVTGLPPELLRRGRFDEIFFLDLPNETEREAILDVHIRKRGRDPRNYNIPKLIEETNGYVGAEIEQGIIDAMYNGFAERREFSTIDISDACKRLVPMSVSQRENINVLRKWLEEGRAQSASG